ncbi:MAG: hypothetical protein ACHQ53_17360, partial [Polyangiales bacterium]
WTRLRLLSTLGTLAHDDPDLATRELIRTKARWGRSGFDLVATMQASAEAMLALYRDDQRACQALLPGYEPFFKSVLSGMPLLRGNALLMRARLALAAARASDAREALCLGAEDDARAAASLGLACFEHHVRLIRAGAAARRGDLDTAQAVLSLVLADRGDQPDVAFTVAAAERRLGALQGGEPGRMLVARADAALRAQGVENPEAFIRLFAPGFDSG